ncbi:MAG: O-antigen ligase family protein [Mucilaginibacter sp.]
MLQLLACNHFTYGSQVGGIFILGGGLSLILYFFTPKIKDYSLPSSTLGRNIIIILISLFIIQCLCVFVGEAHFEIIPKIIATYCFFFMLLLVYLFSKISLTTYDIKRLIICIFICASYMLLVSINQKYSFIPGNALLPSYRENATFELGVFRSSGTLLNFEAYGEYSLSIIALLLPGILSGSIRKLGKGVHFAAILTILISLIAIALSGTRSSILLLPLIIVLITLNYWKKIKLYYIIAPIVSLLIFLAINPPSFLNANIFKRKASFKIEDVSLEKILNGQETNRAVVYEYGFYKISKKSTLIGEGYYPTRNEYHAVHFDNTKFTYPDYHNLYLSLMVIWGPVGMALLLITIFYSIIKGIWVYKQSKAKFSIVTDLLFGFNLFFFFLMLNQYKIQFVRNVNYFFIILIFLALYYSIINIASGKSSMVIYKKG